MSATVIALPQYHLGWGIQTTKINNLIISYSNHTGQRSGSYCSFHIPDGLICSNQQPGAGMWIENSNSTELEDRSW